MPSSSPTFRLTYFPYKGYAEGSRLLAKFLNIDFEEQSIDPDAFGWESLPVGFDQIQRYLPTSTNKYKTRREQTRMFKYLYRLKCIFRLAINMVKSCIHY
jgi:hypothetical protein